ncbi:MAG: crossover junction endodeoxyribonuclease RuvC [Planctomycetota bacterium]
MSGPGLPVTASLPAGAVVIGIDAALTKTGYAVLRAAGRGERPKLVEGGLIRTDATETLADRVAAIGTAVLELVEQYDPAAVAIEGLFAHPKHPGPAIQMAHARGAILYVLAAAGRPPREFAPRAMKQLLTGSGRATKAQIQFAIQAELGLDKPLEPDDVADAAALALCGIYHPRPNTPVS